MKKTLFTALCCVFALNVSAEESQVLIQKGSLGSFEGDEKIFTGTVKVSPIFKESPHLPFSAGLVEFSQHARSAWHTHPLGQNLIVTRGKILSATENGTVHLAEEGDAILCPPNLKHFHGAAGEEAGAHLALTGVKDNQNVLWLEKVSDEEYQNALAQIQKK